MSQVQNEIYAGGFSNPPVEAAEAFRAAMDVIARPGDQRVLSGGTAPGLSEAAATLILTLCDPDTGLFIVPALDSAELRQWVAFHTGAPIVPAQDADFALGVWADLMPLKQFKIGTPEYPDRSATLIVEQTEFGADNAVLSGPGIETTCQSVLPEIAAFAGNRTLFPLGLDFFFTCGDRVRALPRSTEVSQLTTEGV